MCAKKLLSAPRMLKSDAAELHHARTPGCTLMSGSSAAWFTSMHVSAASYTQRESRKCSAAQPGLVVLQGNHAKRKAPPSTTLASRMYLTRLRHGCACVAPSAPPLPPCAWLLHRSLIQPKSGSLALFHS